MKPPNLDTFNAHGVTAFQGYVVAVIPLPQRLTRTEAIRLAAWLIVAAELVDVGADDAARVRVPDALETTADLVKAIRDT